MEGDSLECENELALFVIQGIEKNRQMATRDTMNWFCGCGELPSTVQKYEELFIVAQIEIYQQNIGVPKILPSLFLLKKYYLSMHCCC